MAAMIQSVDEGVGRLVSKLKKSGQRNNTVILFIRDMDLDIIFEHCLYFLKFPQKD